MASRKQISSSFTVSVVEDGDDGKTVRTTTVYTVSSSQPSRPTGSSLPPTGWLSTPPSVVVEFTTITGDFTNIVGGRQSVGEDEEGFLTRDILTFVTTEANQVIAIEIEADTENDFDYIYVGLLDTPVTSRPEDTASDLSHPERAASGGEKKVVLTTVATAGTHTLDIVFAKDSSDSAGSDTVKYSIVTDVWLSEAVMEDGVLTGQWSVPTRWGAAVKRSYKLLPSPTSLSFHRTALDVLTPSSYSVYCGYKVIEDNKETSRPGAVVAYRRFIGPRLMRIFYRKQNQNGTFGSWRDHSAASGSISIANTDYGIEFALSTSVTTSGVNDANIFDRVTIPVLKDGQRGEQGATGVMYYPAGEYASDVTYTNDGNACPMVHHSDEYWYLDPDVSSVTGVAPSDTSGNPWKKAENYGLVITEALFAAFAKFGSFIVSGDFFISQYGTLFTSSSDAEGTPVNQIGQQYQSKVCYTYFRSTDPMAEKPSVNTYPKFRPRKVINALTGEEYMAEGNVRVENDDRGKVNVTIRGTIKADNLYQNMCLFSGGSSGIVYFTITYYIKQKPTIGMGTDYDMDCATAAEVTVNTNFWNSLQVNGYYTEQEITDLQEQYTAGGITPSFIEHNDYATKYFWLKCTGLSNLIQMIPTVSGYGYDTNYPVKLPRAVDFPNKVIEITGWSRGVDERQMYIGCVDDKMRGGIDVDTQAGKFAFYGNPTARITIMTGAVYKFQSISLDSGSNYYWVCLGKAS